MACESIWVRDLTKCEADFLRSFKDLIFYPFCPFAGFLFGYSDYALELIDHQILGSFLEENEKKLWAKKRLG